MTRLSDALDRANEPLTGDRVRHDVPPPGWTFDAGDSARRARASEPITAPAVEPPRVLQPQFPELATRFPEDERRNIVVGPEANGAVVEQYRRLAAALHHAQVERRARSVMIASAVPAEGKTLTSTNLALTLSQSYQRRVLLIDADLRRPSIHTMFGLPNDVGLVECLTQPNGSRLPVQAVSPTLWVLTAGRPSLDPMGALVSTAMRDLLTQAMETFDWVVVDTPPVAILSDAHLLGGMIDTAILVVGARSAPYSIVQRAATAIGPSRILGVVLNRTERRELSDGYGHYADRERYGRAPRPSRWRRWLHKRAH
jgi:capsular exopolysaccharide synthesis family protein